jgi:hypothetical protein
MKKVMSCYDTQDVYNLVHQYWQMEDGYKYRKDIKPESHIWDEDITVRQYKEMTAQHNKTIEEKIEQCRADKAAFYQEMSDSIIAFIVDETAYEDKPLTSAQAKVIWQQVWIDHEDEPWAYLSRYIELATKILSAD